MHRKELQARFCMSDWEFVERLPTARLFRNRLTGRHCEEYLLTLFSDRQKLCYEQRAASTSSHIIKLLHFECFSSFNANNLFTHYNARLFVEHVRSRLGDIPELPQSSSLTMLEETLLGFKTIYDEYQPVRVTKTMVCINQQKRIRVWLSSNLLENSAKVSPSTTEQVMVADIFGLFQRFLPELEDCQNSMDFLQAIDLVRHKKSRLHQPKKVVGVCPPISIDFAPVRIGNEKMYKTGERFQVGPGSTTQIGISPRKQNLTQLVQPTYPYESPNKSQIVSNRSNAYLEQNQLSLQLKDDSLERQQIQSSYDKQSYAPGFEDSDDEDCDGRRQSIVVRIESARTTSKNLLANQRFVELDQNQLQLELLDQKKNKDAKLAIIESAKQRQPNDENVKKLCRIYNHAIKYDPLMYLELQKHQGRISKISNMYVVKKLVELMEQDDNTSDTHSSKFQDTRVTRIKTQDQRRIDEEEEKKRDERIRQILEIERAKRNKVVYNKSTTNYVSNHQQVNKTSPHPSNTSIDTPPPAAHHIKHEKRRAPSYITELESLIGPSNEHERVKMRSGSNNHNIEQKKKQKSRFMKGFKEEVEKLLFD